MERITDTITSVFHVTVKDNRPVACSSGDGTIVWSDTFGLGFRFGISYNPHEWFAKVRLYLDHNQSHTEQDQATVTVTLRENATADGFKERMTTIRNFGHGQPALLGSWSISDFTLHPYVSLTLTTKARLPQPLMDPLTSASLAICQSMKSGDFVDTKFYAFSARRPGGTAGKPRMVYANSDSIRLVLPEASSRAKQEKGLAPSFLHNMTGDCHINENSVLHEYAYEQDSDLDDEEEKEEGNTELVRGPVSDGVQMPGSSSRAHIPCSTQESIYVVSGEETPAEPPAYSISTCRMMLVKGVAYKTWLSYLYFRYTGQVFFSPLKSVQESSREGSDGPDGPHKCSPKSMYRLAAILGDERLKELAFRAIKQGLSKDNVVDEAFSWFTAQYPAITKHELDKVIELRKLPEVSSAIRLQVRAMSLGEKPWASDILNAIMEMLNT